MKFKEKQVSVRVPADLISVTVAPKLSFEIGVTKAGVWVWRRNGDCTGGVTVPAGEFIDAIGKLVIENQQKRRGK